MEVVRTKAPANGAKKIYAPFSELSIRNNRKMPTATHKVGELKERRPCLRDMKYVLKVGVEDIKQLW